LLTGGGSDMVRERLSLLGAALTALVLAGRAAAGGPDPSALAARIDKHLDAHWKAEKGQPAPPPGHAGFLAPAYPDITGRIPRPADVHAFLADKSADKRRKLIDRLLEDPRFAVHFANVWRAEWLPETASNPAAAAFQVGFENWLKQRLRAGVRYDRLV